MVLLFIWPTAKRGRWAFLAYNLLMCTVLVYGAEHYVSDILLGWVYAVIVFVAWNRYWARRDNHAAAAVARP
jgi:membrane-associated phospholipid phosphatase